jgi:hypothetical protein
VRHASAIVAEMQARQGFLIEHLTILGPAFFQQKRAVLGVKLRWKLACRKHFLASSLTRRASCAFSACISSSSSITTALLVAVATVLFQIPNWTTEKYKLKKLIFISLNYPIPKLVVQQQVL